MAVLDQQGKTKEGIAEAGREISLFFMLLASGDYRPPLTTRNFSGFIIFVSSFCVIIIVSKAWIPILRRLFYADFYANRL